MKKSVKILYLNNDEDVFFPNDDISTLRMVILIINILIIFRGGNLLWKVVKNTGKI